MNHFRYLHLGNLSFVLLCSLVEDRHITLQVFTLFSKKILLNCNKTLYIYNTFYQESLSRLISNPSWNKKMIVLFYLRCRRCFTRSCTYIHQRGIPLNQNILALWLSPVPLPPYGQNVFPRGLLANPVGSLRTHLSPVLEAPVSYVVLVLDFFLMFLLLSWLFLHFLWWWLR